MTTSSICLMTQTDSLLVRLLVVSVAFQVPVLVVLRSVGRSVRLGRWGVCPECRQGVERICRAITKQVQRSDARIEVDVMHTWNECTEQAQRMY
jgi:hypothetical protein